MRISDWSSDVCSSDLRGFYQILRQPCIDDFGFSRFAKCNQRAKLSCLGLSISRRHIDYLTEDAERPLRLAARENFFTHRKERRNLLRHALFRRLDRQLRQQLIQHLLELPLSTCRSQIRSEERRVGTDCVSTCRSGGSPYP